MDLSAVQIQVDESAGTIAITLPDVQILSHEIPEESIEVFDETHNLFNPITIEDYTGFTRDQKAEMERCAISEGILVAAGEKAQSTVETFLSLLPGMDEYILTFS